MRMLFMLAAAGALVFLYYANRIPDDWISGHAWVVDGDSVEIFNQRISLFGIDAPEIQQTCKDEHGEGYKCGLEAERALSAMIGDLPISCEPLDRDQHDLPLARCFLGNQDLAASMVGSGHALAYRQTSTDYVDEEDAARTMKLGIWRGEFTPPWVYREQ